MHKKQSLRAKLFNCSLILHAKTCETRRELKCFAARILEAISGFAVPKIFPLMHSQGVEKVLKLAVNR